MRILIILMSLMLVAPARAATPECIKQIYTNPKVEPDYGCPGPSEDELIPKLELEPSMELLAEEPAPWPGILMDKNRALVLGLRIRALRMIRWQEQVRCHQFAAAEDKFRKAGHKASLDFCEKQRENYKRQAAALHAAMFKTTKWYHSGVFWFSAGVSSAIVAVLSIAFIAN